MKSEVSRQLIANEQERKDCLARANRARIDLMMHTSAATHETGLAGLDGAMAEKALFELLKAGEEMRALIETRNQLVRASAG